MSEVFFSGHDPGPSTGCNILIDESGEIVSVLQMPKLVLTVMKTRTKKDKTTGAKAKVTQEGIQTDTNLPELAEWFKDSFKGRIVYSGVEDVKPFQKPISSTITAFMQRNKAMLEALCYAHSKRVFMLVVGKWYNEYYPGKSDKGKAIKVALELCPELLQHMKKAKSQEEKGGIAEAYLMADKIRVKYLNAYRRKNDVSTATKPRHDDKDSKKRARGC